MHCILLKNIVFVSEKNFKKNNLMQESKLARGNLDEEIHFLYGKFYGPPFAPFRYSNNLRPTAVEESNRVPSDVKM